MSEVPLCGRYQHAAVARVVGGGAARKRSQVWALPRKVDARLPGKRNSNFHGARPVHLIIMMIKWIRTSRLTSMRR